MCKAKIILTCLAACVTSLIAIANGKSEIPFRTQRLSERVLFIKSGRSTVMSNATAIATSSGLVIVDAHYKPEWGRKIRQIAKEVFGPRNFLYLIYSHAGVDHMGGAGAFTDTILVGHDNCISRIDALHETLRTTDIHKAMAPRLSMIREQLNRALVDATEKIKLEEALLYWSELSDLTASGFRYAKPSVTFSDRMSLHLGNITLELYYCTPGYSYSDIFIHVPQEKLLIVGDIFTKHRVPLLDEKSDIERWRTLFRPFVEKEIEIRNIISCHGELMTVLELKAQLDYIKDLWEGVATSKQEGLTLEQIKEQFAFKKRYPHLSHLITRWVSTPFDLHERNIDQIWKGTANPVSQTRDHTAGV